MSKSSRKRNKERRGAKKKAVKAARRAQYAAFAVAGKSKWSKRAKKSSRKHALVKQHPHGEKNCGNPGCKKCFPQFAIKKFLKKAA